MDGEPEGGSQYIPDEEREAMSESTWLDNRGLYKAGGSVEWSRLYHMKWQRENRPRQRSTARVHRNWDVPGGTEGFSETVLQRYGLKGPDSAYRAQTPGGGFTDRIAGLRHTYYVNKQNTERGVNPGQSKWANPKTYNPNRPGVSVEASVKINYLLDLPYESPLTAPSGSLIGEDTSLWEQLKKEQEMNPLQQTRPKGPSNFFRQYKDGFEYKPLQDLDWPTSQ